MKEFILAVAAVAAVPCWSVRADDPKKQDVTAQVNQLEKEYRAKAAEFRKEIRERVSPNPEKFVQEFQAYQTTAAKEFLELARQDPASLSAFKALEIAFGALDQQPEQQLVLKLLTEHHIETDGIGDLAVSHAYDDDPTNLAFAESILKRNKNRSDQAKAVLATGLIYRRRAGQEIGTDADRTQATAEARRAFELLKSKYGDAKISAKKSAAEAADTYLLGLENVAKLVVGKVVPDIDGEDLDGKSFKLSDYRGKVVLLDYWAHW